MSKASRVAAMLRWMYSASSSCSLGWTWERWGAAPTYALSSAFALVGLLFVARWVKRTDLDEVGENEPLRVADGSHP